MREFCTVGAKMHLPCHCPQVLATAWGLALPCKAWCCRCVTHKLLHATSCCRLHCLRNIPVDWGTNQEGPTSICKHEMCQLTVLYWCRLHSCMRVGALYMQTCTTADPCAHFKRGSPNLSSAALALIVATYQQGARLYSGLKLGLNPM